MSYSKQLALLVAVIVVTSVLFFNTRVNKSEVDEPTLTTSKKCLDTLPYNVWKDPQIDYYNWYGLEGTSIHGATYLTGHIFERHIAVNGACTLYQKQNNKTVFYNLNEFQKAAASLPYLCPVQNHTTFTYNFDGKIATPIVGIDCMKGTKQTFPAFFVQFKRAIRNSHPTQAQYLNSNYTTIWTFYPKRS